MQGVVVGLLADRTEVEEEAAKRLGAVVLQLVANKAVVVIPEKDPLLSSEAFVHCVFEGAPCLESTILNAERVDVSHPGVHIMRRSGPVDYVESVTSLAATGASLILAYSNCGVFLPGHPFVPLLRVGSEERRRVVCDVLVQDGEDAILEKMMRVLSREESTKVMEKKLVDFQVTRTANGFSLLRVCWKRKRTMDRVQWEASA